MFNTSHLRDESTFLTKLAPLAASLGVSVNSILGVMWIESGIKPEAQNSQTKATGLIQFMPATLQPWGYTTEQVRKMTATQQLVLVEKYLNPYRGKLHTFIDLYLAVFYPAALGKPETYQFPKNVGTYNPAFKDASGVVTVKSIKLKLAALLPAAAKSLIYTYSIPIGLLAISVGVIIYLRKE